MKEQNVQILDRVMDIIELLSTSTQGMGVTEIGNKLKLHKSTVHRLINSLARRGYIEKDPKTSLYKIGLKFVEISSLHLHQLELKTEATPFMHRLAEVTKQVSHLAILDESDVVYIEKVDIVQSIRLYSQIGKRIPVYCSALGKVLLSSESIEKQRQVLDSIKLKSFTENTITDRMALEIELYKTKQMGWAVDNEEHEEGVRCIAAPVRDFTGKVIAALSISGDKNSINIVKHEYLVKSVIEAAEGISKCMGCTC